MTLQLWCSFALRGTDKEELCTRYNNEYTVVMIYIYIGYIYILYIYMSYIYYIYMSYIYICYIYYIICIICIGYMVLLQNGWAHEHAL